MSQPVLPTETPPVLRFPAGFLWGAATSSHQVEGGNRWNDWWEYEEQGRVPYRSREACDHYQLFEADFDLARSWGHNAHRFSLEVEFHEWSPGRADGPPGLRENTDPATSQA